MSRESLQEVWRRRLEEYAASGLSQKQWCLAKELPVHQFHYWRGKLKPASTRSIDLVVDNGWCRLQELPVPVPVPAKHVLEVRVGPATIEVAAGFDGDLLAAVVQALSSR